ncbi:hypothetical protein ETAA8_09540 [Anatilimnocola aggregata]|uniref:Uncharacterized protein n=1 Tax=Anatilimnocola aggregata TaxID=2528021 RepID=A0A517Y6X0_9BACT|nr:hypothetical protein [Anatilimnocola aggregata]QDU25882.1 hypothetical protein ETAA8_09540 [Anatilimnocola aggregata]
MTIYADPKRWAEEDKAKRAAERRITLARRSQPKDHKGYKLTRRNNWFGHLCYFVKPPSGKADEWHCWGIDAATNSKAYGATIASLVARLEAGECGLDGDTLAILLADAKQRKDHYQSIAKHLAEIETQRAKIIAEGKDIIGQLTALAAATGQDQEINNQTVSPRRGEDCTYVVVSRFVTPQGKIETRRDTTTWS